MVIVKSDLIELIQKEDLEQYLAVVNMTPRDKEIVRIYLSERPTYQALGERFEISHERVRQILIKFARKAHGCYRKAHPENFETE